MGLYVQANGEAFIMNDEFEEELDIKYPSKLSTWYFLLKRRVRHFFKGCEEWSDPFEIDDKDENFYFCECVCCYKRKRRMWESDFEKFAFKNSRRMFAEIAKTLALSSPWLDLIKEDKENR